MKLVVAIIRPEKLETVQAVLQQHQVTLMSVGQVMGCGSEPGRKEVYRGSVFVTRPPKLRMEMVVYDALVDGTVDAIIRVGATGSAGRLGDGEILVMHMDECVHICNT